MLAALRGAGGRDADDLAGVRAGGELTAVPDDGDADDGDADDGDADDGDELPDD